MVHWHTKTSVPPAKVVAPLHLASATSSLPTMRALRGVSRRLSTPALKPPSAHALGWRVTPVAHALGAEIEGADLSHIGATEFAAVREALLQYEVIFFKFR